MSWILIFALLLWAISLEIRIGTLTRSISTMKKVFHSTFVSLAALSEGRESDRWISILTDLEHEEGQVYSSRETLQEVEETRGKYRQD